MVAFQSGKKTKATLPVSKHPLFPAMVALWFAALFGLGSLAIRPTLLEKFVLALRLDLVVPAAAPPLGFTSRILLALMMFVIGAAIGFTIARKIARSGGERVPLRTARTAHPSTRASFNEAATDEDEDFSRLSAARPAQSNPIPGRRRALAMEEDYVNDYRDHAPLPGHEPQILDLATLGGLSEYTGPEESAVAETVPQEPVAAIEPVQTAAQVPTFDPWNRHAPEVVPVELHTEVEQPNVSIVETQQAHRAFDTPAATETPAEGLRTAQPIDFHRPAFAAPEEVAADPFVPQAQARPFDATPATRAFDPAPEPAPAAAPQAAASITQPVHSTGLGLMPRDAVEKLTSAPLASLGVVQLAERLALAIARRKTPGEADSSAPAPLAFAPASPAFAQPEAVAPEPQPAPQPQVAAELEVAVAALAEEVSAAVPALAAEPAPAFATAMPRSMRPLQFDDGDADEDDALESILPPRRFAMPSPAAFEAPAAPAEPQPVAAAPAEEDENFASLLGMKPSLRQSFVRVEEPVETEAPVEPVVIFPGQAPRFASIARPFEAPAQPAPAAEPSSAPTPIEAGRRFDAPSTVFAGSPSPAPSIDPEETERALKAALATLQRMSGAA